MLTPISLAGVRAKSAKDELMEYHQEFFWHDTARLVSGGEIVKVVRAKRERWVRAIAPLHSH
ncbi:hypothetical protein CQ14_39925 [Bradyrhizobium lablabi]|uniref:Uncharacterized protein n=1 Tax=Bradyrhizobium lablabi TaxID=722472 RepID=A0A0R3MCF1_9BRAD|nr:hypothetical protein CQ14_39925 [Bradyrhizobium lablabi]